MRTIEYTTAFRRDFRRVRKGRHRRKLAGLLEGVLALLVADEPLPVANRDHQLAGAWTDHRDCHLAPDLVLIYGLPDAATLRLVRLGSHAELFG
jgi:mRNA interferase YafQ